MKRILELEKEYIDKYFSDKITVKEFLEKKNIEVIKTKKGLILNERNMPSL